jgi:ankyrin repeat protein
VTLENIVRGGSVASLEEFVDRYPHNLDVALGSVAGIGTPEQLGVLLRRQPTRDGLDAALGQLCDNLWLTDEGDLPGRYRLAALLIEAGATPDAVAVWRAAKDGHAALVRLLLTGGGDPNAWPEDREPALHAAVRVGSADTVEVLLDAGADPDVIGPGDWRPLDLADGPVADVLRRRGARRIEPGEVSLVEAARRGYAERVAELLPGASPQDRGAALGVAVGERETALVPAILAHPVAPDALTVALGQAVAFDLPDVVSRLVAAGVDIDSDANYYRSPPVVDAAARGRTAIVRLLVAAGADLSRRNEDGHTALEVARRHGRRDVVRLLGSAAAPARSAAAIRSAVRAKLERRDTWTPALLGGEYAGRPSRFGGTPWRRPGEAWPACGRCARPMTFFVQIDLATAPTALRQPGMLQVFRCTNCSTFHADQLVRIADDLSPAPATETFPARSVLRWHRAVADYPRNEVPLDAPEEAAAAQQLNRRGEKLGGWPAWVQDPAYPDCPNGDHPMSRLLLQLDSGQAVPYRWGDNGVAYVLQCPRHLSAVTLVWQAT